MDGNYISGNASQSFYFSFSLLIQIERFFHLEIMASFSNHGSSSIGDSLVLLFQIALAFHPQMTMGCTKCLQTWIYRNNVFLQLQLLLPTHVTCSMAMS